MVREKNLRNDIISEDIIEKPEEHVKQICSTSEDIAVLNRTS